MVLVYCKDCDKVVAAGPIPSKVKVRGRWTSTSIAHVANGRVHTVRAVEVSDAPRKQGESVGAYLLRLAKIHKDALR